MAVGQTSPYLVEKLLNHTLRNITYTPPATVYVGLFLSDPGGVAGGEEVSGGSYVRKPIVFAAPVDGLISNSVTVDFDESTTDWGNVTHFGLFDTATPNTGNLLFYGDADSAMDVVASTDVTVPPGRVKVKLG